MTHYDIDYSKLDGDAKRAKAVADTLEYMGTKQFSVAVQLLKDGISQSDFNHGMSLFAGVNGYPLLAMWETYAPTSAAKPRAQAEPSDV